MINEWLKYQKQKINFNEYLTTSCIILWSPNNIQFSISLHWKVASVSIHVVVVVIFTAVVDVIVVIIILIVDAVVVYIHYVFGQHWMNENLQQVLAKLQQQ